MACRVDEFPPVRASHGVPERGGPMPNIVVRYRTKPEYAEENQKLIENVFAQLAAMDATGFAYTSLRLDDGVSFVHIVVEDDGPRSVSLTDLPAFREFQAGIAER